MYYHIVAKGNKFELEEAVVRMLKQGYKPTGGIAISEHGNYLQAVYKDTK